MILGHLPAGYVVAKLLHRRFVDTGVTWRAFLCATLAGSIAPDGDLLYYLIDSSVHHHAFPTHFPVVWLCLLLAAVLGYRFSLNRKWAMLALVFALGGLLHLCLDSIAGSIRWLAPFDYRPCSLTTVPRLTGSRRLDYLQHWSSWLELVPMVGAGLLWWRDRQRH